ncbi:MAG: glycosyltransferase [bacterium]
MDTERRYNFVIIARDEWGEVWRRRQFLASEFAAMGHRVLFVERPFSVLRALAGRRGDDNRKLRRVLGAVRTPSSPAENLFVVSPLKFFPEIAPALRRLNLALLTATIKSAVSKTKMENYILWINPEYCVHLIPYLEPDLIVYDVTDDWTEAPLPDREKRQIGQEDQMMMAAADVVFTVSQNLYEKKVKPGRRVFLVPNGAATELYRGAHPVPDDLAGLPRPILGYTGTIHPQRIDVELLEKISRVGDGDFSVVLVGPNLLPASAQDRLRRCTRVHLLGTKTYFEVPAYVVNFDACIIPHKIDAFTTSLNPIKVYEYLAAGKPIVSTLIDGAEEFSRFIVTAKTAEEFAAAALRLGRQGTPPDAEGRIAAAQANSWRVRAEQILKIFESVKIE